MTEHLLRRPDTPVAIHGRGRDPYVDLLDADARWHDTACSLAAESSVVLLMLPDLPQVEEVRQTLHTTTNNPPRFRSEPGIGVRFSRAGSSWGSTGQSPMCIPAIGHRDHSACGRRRPRACGWAGTTESSRSPGKSSCRSRSVVSSERQRSPTQKRSRERRESTHHVSAATAG